MQVLTRFALLIAVLVLGVWLIASHGVRGIAIVVAGLLLWTITRSRAWRAGEGWLIRLTGSRQRALAVLLGTIVALTVAVDVVDYLH
ncbi:MAG TPA: hypothetical protein VKX16_06135 [Chloroflexota bacterium]|nr:hypothetical protein [Chloroflexota bacterium]